MVFLDGECSALRSGFVQVVFVIKISQVMFPMALGRTRGRPGSMASLGIGHVGLKVDDLEKSVEFYRNILGLDSRASKRGVARIPSGQDKLVLHEKNLGTSGFHFGFRLDSPSKVDEWK